MIITALLIAFVFAYLVNELADIVLTDKFEDFENGWDYYPNRRPWEYGFIRVLCYWLGLVEFLVVHSLFAGGTSWFSLVENLVFATFLGLFLSIFVSQILFCIVIDGTRFALAQREKCLKANERKQRKT